MSVYINRRAFLAFNATCLSKTERFLKITDMHAHCESGSISEMVLDRYVVTMDH